CHPLDKSNRRRDLGSEHQCCQWSTSDRQSIYSCRSKLSLSLLELMVHGCLKTMVRMIAHPHHGFDYSTRYSLTITLLMIASLNSGRSFGVREVIKLPSTTRSSSAQLAPALRRSVCRLGKLVMFRSLSTSASVRIHAA